MPTTKPWVSPSDLSPTNFGIDSNGQIAINPAILPTADPFDCADLAACSLANLGSANFTDLDDTPAALGAPLTQLRVNAAGNEIEFFAPTAFSDQYWILSNGGNQVLAGALANTAQVSYNNVAADSGVVSGNSVTIPEDGIYLIGGSISITGPLSPLPNAAITELQVRRTAPAAQILSYLGRDRNYFDASMPFVTSGFTGAVALNLAAGSVIELDVSWSANTGTFTPTISFANFWGFKLL